jgi:hypothetical protein
LKYETAASFWVCDDNLPAEFRNFADMKLDLLQTNLSHPFFPALASPARIGR